MNSQSVYGKPSIRRMVIYQAHGSPNGAHKPEPRAAVVTRVHDETCVDLCVLNPTGMFFSQSIVFDPYGGPGTWRWDEEPLTRPVL